MIDGDTLVVADTRIRLQGIDAPETGQVCLDRSGESWPCGIAARDRLAAHIGARGIACSGEGIDRYGRTIGTCAAGSEDLNAWMVREGLALAYVQYSNAYVSDEANARNAGRGMWAGSFIAPWDYRHRNKATLILGAASLPLSAQSKLLAPVAAGSGKARR